MAQGTGSKDVHSAVADRWLSVPQAAALLGVARSTLLGRCLRGELRTDLVAGRSVVLREDVEALLAARRAAA